MKQTGRLAVVQRGRRRSSKKYETVGEWIRVSVQGSARLEGVSTRIATHPLDLGARLERIVLKG